MNWSKGVPAFYLTLVCANPDICVRVQYYGTHSSVDSCDWNHTVRIVYASLPAV